jgi:dihydrodipicolinate synthase/N-acetylneuraminate lyase
MRLPLRDPVLLAPTPMPLRADDSIDHDALARNVERWNRTRLSGFVVGSGGGEELYFSDAELLDALRTVVASRAEGKYVVGGIDTPSVTEARRLAAAMAELGADLLRVRIPHLPSGASRGNVVAYFEELAHGSPLPIVVIHQTFLTGGQAASPGEIAAVCALDAVVAYIFWLDVRFESYVRQLLPPGVRFWNAGASLLLPGAVIGADGACGFFANWGPDLVTEILELGLAGDYAGAAPLQRRLVPADYLGFVGGVAALKAGLNLLGYEGTVPRRPVPPLDEARTAELAAALRLAGLLD